MLSIIAFPIVLIFIISTQANSACIKSRKAEGVRSNSSAPAYWTAECNEKMFLGSYTVMLSWDECQDYCQYFPHAGELGYSFQFADILSEDEMECLRNNMNDQHDSGNGYAGDYWVGGYRGDDGEYYWTSGNPFTYNDFIDDPENWPYIHLTPHNNYKWNTQGKMDQNNGCLCKSVETVAKRKVDGQDMVYQSLKFSNGLWALAELKIKPGSSTIGVSVCPI